MTHSSRLRPPLGSAVRGPPPPTRSVRGPPPPNNPGRTGSASTRPLTIETTSEPLPPPPLHGSTKATQIDRLVRSSHSRTAAKALKPELSRLPEAVLRKLVDGQTKIVAVRDSVTDALPHLKGVRPRGWPPGSTWDSVPGLYDPGTNQVIVATRKATDGSRFVPPTGDQHGSANLVLHETMHAHDALTGNSNSDAFRQARSADSSELSAYESQEGSAGRQESYAESAALYYSRARNYDRKNLDSYFRTYVGRR